MWWIILKQAVLGFFKKEEAFISGTLAFYALLAFFPFMIFLTSLAGLYGDTALVQEGIHYLIYNTPQEIRDVIIPVVDEVTAVKSESFLTLGLLGTLWVLMTGVDALRSGLNRAYCISERRSFFRRTLQSLAFVFFLAFALTLTSIAIILGPILLDMLYLWVPQAEEWALFWNITRYTFGFFIMTMMMSSIYYFLPNITHMWRRVLPGAFIATLFWILLASLFSLYLAQTDSYTVTYGSLSGIIIALVFLKVSAIIFLFGAEINHAYLQYHHAENRGEDPKTVASPANPLPNA